MSKMMKTLPENFRRVVYCTLAGLVVMVGLVLVAGIINAVGLVPSRGEGNVVDRGKEFAYLREATIRIETMTRSTYRFAELIRYPESTDDWYFRVIDELTVWRKNLDWWQGTIPPSSFQQFHDLRTEAAKETYLASEAFFKGTNEARSYHVDPRLVSKFISLAKSHMEKALVKETASLVELDRLTGESPGS